MSPLAEQTLGRIVLEQLEHVARATGKDVDTLAYWLVGMRHIHEARAQGLSLDEARRIVDVVDNRLVIVEQER